MNSEEMEKMARQKADDIVLEIFGPEVPSDEGRRRYCDEPVGYYTANGAKTPCTCCVQCEEPCKGDCGCPACHESYGDFLGCE